MRLEMGKMLRLKIALLQLGVFLSRREERQQRWARLLL